MAVLLLPPKRYVCLHVVTGARIGHCSDMLLGFILSSGKKSGTEVFVTEENEQAYLSGGGVEAGDNIRSCCSVVSMKVLIHEVSIT
jgi:hypothetical protein